MRTEWRILEGDFWVVIVFVYSFCLFRVSGVRIEIIFEVCGKEFRVVVFINYIYWLLDRVFSKIFGFKVR